jgi:CDP-glucose 4,6-dehydratase
MSSGVAVELLALAPKVMITGHTGFKGTWLTLLLEKLNFEISGYSLQPEENSLYSMVGRRNKIVEIFGDIRNFEQLNDFISETKPSIIFHLAAQPLVLESYSNPLLTFETNVIGTANLLEAASRSDSVKAVIVVTTDKVYENLGLKRNFKESDPLRGSDPYSASKVATESVVDAWRKLSLHKKNSLKIITVRSGNVIGGGDTSVNRLLPDLIKKFKNEDDVVIRNPNSTRPWQHVLDPLFGYLLAAKAALKGESFTTCNFGPLDESLTVIDVAKIALKRWGGSISLIEDKIPSNLESKFLGLDSSFAQNQFGWKPFWNQPEAIVATVDWWKLVSQGKATPLEACNKEINDFIEHE